MKIGDAGQVMAMRAALIAKSDALRGAAGGSAPQGAQAGGFRAALESVSRMQGEADQASAAFERGDLTDIAQVMLTRQKAAIAFEATVQVRNKLVSAYRDILNMPV